MLEVRVSNEVRVAHFSRSLIFLFGCAALLCGALPAAALDGKKIPTPVIVLIDMQRILDESIAAKAVQKQVEAQRSKFQLKTEGEENELRKAEQDLSNSRTQLSTEVYAEREQQLRQRFLAEERHVQARRNVLDKGFTDSMAVVRSHLANIVQSLAREKGANLVLTKQQALWVDKDFDVTDEVLDHLNKDLPQVPVSLTPDEGE